jgi:hypothetical protein
VTPPTRPQPDLEAHLWRQLEGLEGVNSWAYSVLPSWPPWVVAYSVQVDCRRGGKQTSWELAERCRRILWDLPSRPWNDGVVVYSQVIEGPAWLPDDDGAPRYMLRAEIRARPNRTAQGEPAGPLLVPAGNAPEVSGKG